MFPQNTGTLAVVSKSGWTASEELSLLDAIENFGYGNWEDIANHIETRTPEGIDCFLVITIPLHWVVNFVIDHLLMIHLLGQFQIFH